MSCQSLVHEPKVDEEVVELADEELDSLWEGSSFDSVGGSVLDVGFSSGLMGGSVLDVGFSGLFVNIVSGLVVQRELVGRDTRGAAATTWSRKPPN